MTPLAKYNDPEADPEFVSYDIKEIGFKLERKYDTRDKFIDIIDKESAEKMYTSIN